MLRGVSRRVGFERRPASSFGDTAVEVILHVGRTLAIDEPAMRRVVEQLVGRAEVFADVIRLSEHMSEKSQVLILVADEVVNGDVSRLAVAVESSVSLFESRRIPR